MKTYQANVEFPVWTSVMINAESEYLAKLQLETILIAGTVGVLPILMVNQDIYRGPGMVKEMDKATLRKWMGEVGFRSRGS